MEYLRGVPLIWILISAVASQWATESRDARNRAIRCFDQIMEYGAITNLLIDVTTPEAIDDFCRRHGDLLKCTRDNEHSMTVQETSEYQKNISGVNNFYVQLCPPGTDITADYKENAACFKRVAHKILYCGSDLPDVNSYRMRNDLHYRCCALNRHRECIQADVRESCGEPAAEVAGKILVRYFDRQIKFCKTPSSDCDTADGGRTTPVHRWHGGPPSHPTEKDRRGASPSPDREWDWNDATEATEWKRRKHHSGAPMATLAIATIACSLVALVALGL